MAAEERAKVKAWLGEGAREPHGLLASPPKSKIAAKPGDKIVKGENGSIR